MLNRIDPFSLIIPERITEKFTLKDPTVAGETELLLQPIDAVDLHRLETLTDEIMLKYLGNEQAGIEPYPFPWIGGEVRWNRGLVKTACSIYVMQAGEPVYTIEELIVIAHTMPAGWEQLVTFSTRLNNKGPLGKVARVSVEKSRAS